MPTINDSSEEVLQSIGKHTTKIGSEELRDKCLNNAEEVAEDSKTTDADMVKTVPYSITVPRNDEVDDERFTPVTDKSVTPAPVSPALAPKPNSAEEGPSEEPGPDEEIRISSRPSSASPARLRSAGKEKSPSEVLKFKAMPQHSDLLNLYTAKSSPKNQQKPISFRELTAEFDRMLKPLSQQYAANSTQGNSDDWYYDTSGDCEHPVLAVEPRNPATPPTSFKIHKQRTVIKPGYTYLEPVLMDVPMSPEYSEQGIENLLEIAANMKPIPPRIDNFTHHPPSRHLLKPCYYSPRLNKPAVRKPKQNIALNSKFTSHSKCSTANIDM
ncbi:uncharacterized protein LOC134811581 [Bolinopsis microptera]|uniref:uncharacterized protein LOC134811581 n=1 Tax=Bolinopsis microptera TaxID=2820187 RepID=UPI00307A197B